MTTYLPSSRFKALLDLEEQEEQERGDQDSIAGLNSTAKSSQAELNTSNVSEDNNMDTT